MSWLKRLAPWIMVFVLFFGGVLFLIPTLLPYGSVKALGDRLSKDGNLQSLSPALFRSLIIPLRCASAVLIAVGLVVLLAPAKTRDWSSRLGRFGVRAWKKLRNDGGVLLRDLRPTQVERPYLYVLAGIMVVGVLARVLFLSKPMSHDESYTYVAFASRPWWHVVSNYELPNNHVFHSILVKLSVMLFGLHPWSVRFPAFISGILGIPVVYLLAVKMYNRTAALLSAGLIATLPIWTDYTTNARGYSQYTMFSLLIFGLGLYLLTHKNLAAWALIVLFSTLGFYTVPVMFYPFSCLLIWLLVSSLAGQSSPEYGGRLGMLNYIVAAGIMTGILTILLYSPIVLGTGIKSFVANSFISSLSLREFRDTFVVRALETWQEWTWNTPLVETVLLVMGFIISLLLHWKISSLKIPFQWTILISLGLILFIQRPNPWARIWTFLIPFYLIWAAAGLVASFQWMGRRWTRARIFPEIVAGIALATLVWGAWAHSLRYYPTYQPAPGKIERTALYLKPILRPGDAVIISSSDAPNLWFYFDMYHLSADYVQWLEKRHDFTRAFVLVNPGQGETLYSAIQNRKLDPSAFDLNSAHELTQMDDLIIYECFARQ